jgi:hypothetical protein
MFDLDAINSKEMSEKHSLDPFGEIYIKLINESELNELLKKSVAEQIAFCLLDKDGGRHFADDKIEEIKSKMKLKHQDEIINLVMKVNRFAVKFEEDVKE